MSSNSSDSEESQQIKIEDLKLEPQDGFEKVPQTKIDESVTPIVDSPPPPSLVENNDKAVNNVDWSIPDPPSGFQDSIIDVTMIPEPMKRGGELQTSVPVIAGPIQFSIDSYKDRTVKEEPYTLKLSRTDSIKDETSKPLSKVESFSLARFNGEATISGK